MPKDDVQRFSNSLKRISSLTLSQPNKLSLSRELYSLQHNIRNITATLKPSIESDTFEISGSQLPVFYHAGKKLVDDVEDSFFEGWYGWGFYAAFDPDYVRRWYGPIVTQLSATPDAKVLLASVDSGSALPGLVEKVAENESQAIGDEEKTKEFLGFIAENQLQWIHAIDRIAIEEYDIVVYSDEQIVVKNPDAVVISGEHK